MTPEFIALCSLTTRANARIRGLTESPDARWRSEDDERYTFEAISSSGTFGLRRRVARSPTQWLEWLVGQRCCEVSLTMAVPEATELALRRTLRLNRYGTNTFAFLIVTFMHRRMVWTNTSEPIGKQTTDVREWRYVGINGNVRPPSANGVSSAKAQLKIALDRARRFAQVEHVLAHWIDRFDRASLALESRSPLEDAPEAAEYRIAFRGVDLSAVQLFVAGILAQIGGGMGSWGDAYLRDPANDAEHLACGRELHAAAMSALCGAVNASRPMAMNS